MVGGRSVIRTVSPWTILQLKKYKGEREGVGEDSHFNIWREENQIRLSA